MAWNGDITQAATKKQIEQLRADGRVTTSSQVVHGDAALRRAVHMLERSGHQITVTPTTGPRTAGAIARRAIDRGAG